MTDAIICKYCGRDNFASARGLSHHLVKFKACRDKEKAELLGVDQGYMTAQEFLEVTEITRRQKRDDNEHLDENMASLPRKNEPFVWGKSCEPCEEFDDDMNGDFHQQNDDSDDDMEEQPSAVPHTEDEPDHSLLDDYQKYLEYANNHLVDFDEDERVAIELLWTLRRTKAALNTYEAIMFWHFRARKLLKPHEKLGKCPYYISRTVLFKRLAKRYNMDGNKYNIVRPIILPGSRAKARVILNDAKAVIQSLLTDPRIRDDDYLFFNDDPFAPPPPHLDHIADMNTGLCYTKTYAKLITKPGKQILLPVPFYIDGAATGQFAHLPVTAVKFTLGIFTRRARDNPLFWRTLGYIPATSKSKSRGQRQLLESGHVDSIMAHQDTLHGEGNLAGAKACVAQDLHAMLEIILESFLPLQDRGFVWNFYYKGKLYKDVEFVPFVPFIKSDTEEADRLAGKYLSRGAGVRHLCRYCCCPTAESDDPLADYPRKTVPMIKALLDNNDVKGLKAMSQQNIKNATYLLRFGAHNDEGVHGACPLEMLHALCLGIFKYVRDCFFEQVGESSWLAGEIDALAIEYGVLFCRQSDRDMPKTQFSNGIRKGKLMAKEYTGVLLVMAAVLRSSRGHELLSGKTNGVFAEDSVIEDWITLIETLLMWEEWLKSDVMDKKNVRRSEKKHRFIMYLVKKVGKRVKGMGLKITKFHAIMHMATDILHFGVPMEYDTGSNEAGHKPTKTAAKLTQRRVKTFDEQVGKRLIEEHQLDLAIEEMSGRPVWEYFDGYWSCDAGVKAKKQRPPRLGGVCFKVVVDPQTGRNELRLETRTSGKEKITVERAFVDFVASLQDAVAEHIDTVRIRGNHHRNDDVFRGSPMHSGGVWRDWVTVDWEDDGVLPNKIWGFADLRQLPENSGVDFGGLCDLAPALYAIVESAAPVKDRKELKRSELLIPIRKEIGQVRKKRVTKLQFYLADVETFVEPLVVVPDIGGPPNAYFMCRSRAKWREDFISWLESPYEVFDNDDDSDDDEEQEPYQESEDDVTIDEEDEDSLSEDDQE